MSVTVILNVYKRPYTLIEQLRAVQNQSVPPTKIIIWKNFAEGIELPSIPSELMKKVTTIQSSENYGVWARFTPGLLVNTEYICVFDDDTIPQRKWLENCLNTQKTHPGLLGAIGILFCEGNRYITSSRFGWDGVCDRPVEVDIVGHSWFFRQEWLGLLWQFRPNYDIMLKAGEDIAFSYILQKNGIKTYVPPHPKDDIELYGSDPLKARQYGTDSAAISMDYSSAFIFDSILKNMIDNLGFETIANRKIKEEREKSMI
jgi:hypothetical protein